MGANTNMDFNCIQALHLPFQELNDNLMEIDQG